MIILFKLLRKTIGVKRRRYEALKCKLSNTLNDSYTSVLKKYSEELFREIEDFLENFEHTTRIFTSKEGIEVGLGFNVKASLQED